ncbi:NADH-quinone oxidoreductase subunit L [bacterium]|nr:MAG: NADH-quinone oxidoreductase subunit L [bacterium]
MDLDLTASLIIATPLAGFLLNGLAGLFFPSYRKLKTVIGSIATLAVAIPFLLVVNVFLQTTPDAGAQVVRLFTWIQAGDFTSEFAYRFDQLSLIMGMVVTGVGSLIHIYSMGYMKDDEGYYKFFAYLNLFIFMMMNLVMGNNLLLLFLGWEGVGVSSYLLIGFWYQDQEKAAAGMKAFVYNRVGDFAFLIAMFMTFQTIGSLDFDVIINNLDKIPGDYKFWIAFLMFVGATGKSAQLPLFVWLPDAMAGPTPVSALIHAATMVTSGIYLIARMSFLYVFVPEVMIIVAVVGAVTAIVAASIAITQQDIKKVLAYSTVSQLGYMFLALGSGGFIAAIFHVVTHAFFKACLFLGSGSVIHAMHHVEHELHHHGKHAHFDPQDMRFMGGLRKYMPSTYITFLVATIAIAGIPPLAGFFSKDEILAFVFNASNVVEGASALYIALWGIGIVTALMTAFYMFRLTFTTFHGEFKLPKKVKGAEDSEKYLHESPITMTLPLWVLGILSLVGGFMGIPDFIVHHGNWLHHWLEGVTAHFEFNLSHSMEWILLSVSVVIAVTGVSIAYFMYFKGDPDTSDAAVAKRFGSFYQVWSEKYRLDEFYEGYIANPVVRFSDKVLAVFDMKVVDGFVNLVAGIVRLSGSLLRYVQTGLTSSYAFMLVLGVVLVIGIIVFS